MGPSLLNAIRVPRALEGHWLRFVILWGALSCHHLVLLQHWSDFPREWDFFRVTHGIKWFVSIACVCIRHLSDRCLQKCTCVIAPVCVYGRVDIYAGHIKVIQPDHVICKSFSDLLLSAHGGHQDHRAWHVNSDLSNSWSNRQSGHMHFTGFLMQEYWILLAFLPSVHHVLSGPFTVTRTYWVSLHCMAQSFIELGKPFCLNKAVIHEGCPDAGKDWRQKEEEAAEDEMVI